MKYNILTVSREFGSGGRTVGKLVAEKLGIPFYDKDLVNKVALETGFTKEYIEEAGEYAHVKSRFAFLLSLAHPFTHSSSPHPSTVGASHTPPADYVWAAQSRVIRSLADQGPCVIVGRCADYILKDRKDVLHVFIHAPKEARAERIVRIYGEKPEDPFKRLDEKDKKRMVHYNHFTGRSWGMSQNYMLSLDSEVVGIEKCAEIIASTMLKNAADGIVD